MWVLVKEIFSFNCTEYHNVSNLAFDSATNTYTITYDNSGTPATTTVNGSNNYVMVLMNNAY